MRSLAEALGRLPPRTEQDPDRVRERRLGKEALKRRLAALLEEAPEIAAFVAENIRVFNGVKGLHLSFDRLDDLLGRQVWRLAHWRVAADEINYRRFFDLNHLAAIRVEDREVFDAVHQLVFRLVEEGAVTGLRIDHTDGLADPAAYLRDLRDECRARVPLGSPFYIVVEKIIARGESLPEDWPVQGTTGYDFLNAANGLFVNPQNAGLFEALYRRFTGSTGRFADVAYEKKKLVMQVSMSGEANALARRLKDIAAGNRHTRDFTLNSLTKALVEVIACFPVYRTYVTAAGVREMDRGSIARAAAEARRRNPAMSRSIFDFLAQVLLLELPVEAEGGERAERLDFVRKFQQFTGPVMARGVEDTAFYIDNRLVSLNEVGGGPDRFGTPVNDFHARNAERLRAWPHGLNTTSTHDTKRSEDVRARIDALSEMPVAWRTRLARWRRMNEKRRRMIDDRPAPDANEECLIYQTLVGAWPLPRGESGGTEAFTGRIKEYVLKALREAKVNTSWIDQDRDYEEAVMGFVAGIIKDAPGNRFLRDFAPFQAAISELGMYNSLSQTLLKIASPGVPDFYQGTEIWDFSLVDPDNRRQVDFEARKGLLDGLKELEARLPAVEVARELTARKEDGRIKLYVISKALACRRAHREIFESGGYLPLACEGPRAGNICAFARAIGPKAVLVVAPRLFAELVPGPGVPPQGEPVWKDSFLLVPPQLESPRYLDIFTGQAVIPARGAGVARLALGEVLADFPVALLETEA